MCACNHKLPFWCLLLEKGVVMNFRITELLEEIKEREIEIEKIIKSYEEEFFYKIEGTRVEFDRIVEEAHQQLKVDLVEWLLKSEVRNVVSAPFIYPMIIPFLLMDVLITVYQVICFYLYRIPAVKRSDYIIIDRHHLKYLNRIEKINCMYCGYVNGLISYMREIVARTEEYWCPIKHARKIYDPHKQYMSFIEFGNSEGYQKHIKSVRKRYRNKI